MVLKIKHFVIFTTILFCSCSDKVQNPKEIKAIQIAIGDSIKSNDSIAAFVKPYHDRINAVLDSTLAYSSNDLVMYDGKLNCSAGNFLADLVLEQGNPIFKSRTGKSIDFVLLNHGGIRSIVSKGPVNSRTAYQVMPFDNYIMVVEMDGKAVTGLLDFLAKSGRAHPIANMKLILNAEGNYMKKEINGKPFNINKTYYVATNDYLLQGGDNMGFFKNHGTITNTDYLIRNAIIDYFKKMDTITSTVDNRFIQLN